MEKEQTYTFRISAELKKAFNETCGQVDIPASQVLRKFMADFVKQQAQRQLPLGKK